MCKDISIILLRLLLVGKANAWMASPRDAQAKCGYSCRPEMIAQWSAKNRPKLQPQARQQRSRVSHFGDGALKYVTGARVPGLGM